MKYKLIYIILFSIPLDLFSQEVIKTDTAKTVEPKTIRAKVKVTKKPILNLINAIADANELFKSGEYDTCIALVQNALNGWGSKMDQRETLLEILVQCYLEKDDLPNANLSMIRLLHNDPNYEVNQGAGNSEDFYRLVNQYEVFPGFSIGMRNTDLRSSFVTTKTYSLPNNPALNYNAQYVSSYAYYVMYYGWMEYEFKRNWALDLEGLKYTLSYGRILANNPNSISAGYNENVLTYRAPFYLRRYEHISKSFSFYLGLGFSYDRITQAKAQAEYYDFPNKIIENGNNIVVTDLKNQNNFEWLAAGGIGYTIKRIRLFADLRYYGGITSLTNPSAGLTNSTLVNQFHYIDNAVKLNQYEYGATAAIIISYKVKKKK